MAEILARCGYRCDLCPGYTGNIHSDKDRQEASDGWYKYAGFRLAPEDINCPGCSGNNATLDKECPVRPCVMQKKLDNCGQCPDMPCEKLDTRMNFVEERLRVLPNVPENDFDKFLRPYASKARLAKIQANYRASGAGSG
jgi:hypothetical protein